jgi:CheY-like chemotaxis protein
MHSPSPDDKPRSRRIAVVGNKTQDILSLSFLLQRFDYEVAVANTAAQALDLVSSYRPALVISDVVLPGMSGLDLLHLLKQDDRTTSLPVVFMVPLSDAGAESRSLGMGAAGCITKPIQVEELYRAIQEIIEPRPRAYIRVGARLSVTLNDLPLAGGYSRATSTCPVRHTKRCPNLPRNKRVPVQIHLNDRRSRWWCVLFSHPTTEVAVAGHGTQVHRHGAAGPAFIRSFIATRSRTVSRCAPTVYDASFLFLPVLTG